jgi:DNA polymerase I-like protein with 3'-5' exonuclease and polymerase domains
VPLHQWKNDPEFRDPIEAPEGYTLLEFDFAGQEFRWMAVMSGDYTMLKLCAPGEDAHSFMGAKIGHKDYDWLRRAVHQPSDLEYALAKKLRKLGKVGNLSLQYRTSAPALQRVARTNHGLILSDPESVAIHGTYRMTYPGVQVYWKHQIAKARLTGWIETIAGRRVQVGPGDSWKRLAVREVKGEVREEFVDNKWAAESTAINFPIQGSGADQKYAALKLLKDYLPSVDGRFYFELHDGIFVVVPDRHADRAAHEVKHLLSNIDYKKLWGVDLPIQFPVDAKLGKTWGQLKEIVG